MLQLGIMPSGDIYQRLTDIMREVFDDDEIVARPDLTAEDVLGWDSFANLRLIQAIAQSFEVEFTAAEIHSIRNVGELATLVGSRARS